MRRKPQPGFSRARRTMSSCSSLLGVGRRRRVRRRYAAHLRRTSSRCQRSSVSGLGSSDRHDGLGMKRLIAAGRGDRWAASEAGWSAVPAPAGDSAEPGPQLEAWRQTGRGRSRRRSRGGRRPPDEATSSRAADPDYKRPGTTTLFAALDVATGEVTGACDTNHRAAEFLSYLKLVVRSYPRRHLHLIVDNASSHQTPEVKEWLAKHRRIHLHFTPTGSSWLNHAETWFSIPEPPCHPTRSLHQRAGAHRRDPALPQWLE